MQSLRFEGMEPHLPGKYPVVILRDIVVFPHLICPLFVGRETSVRAVERALETDRFLFLTAQRDLNIEYPMPKDMYTVGTICLLLRMIRVKEGNKMKVLIQGLRRAEICSFVQTEPFFMAEVEKRETAILETGEADMKHLLSVVKGKLDKIVFTYGKTIPTDILVVIENLEDPERLAHLVAGNIGLDVPQAQEVLEIVDPLKCLKRVDDILNRQLESLQGG